MNSKLVITCTIMELTWSKLIISPRHHLIMIDIKDVSKVISTYLLNKLYSVNVLHKTPHGSLKIVSYWQGNTTRIHMMKLAMRINYIKKCGKY